MRGVTATARRYGMLAQRSTSSTTDDSVTVCVKHTPHASLARAHRLGRGTDHAHVRDFPRANGTTLPQAATSPSTDLVCEAGVMMW